MNKLEIVKELLSKGFSVRKAAKEIGVDHSTILYWKRKNFDVACLDKSTSKEGKEIECAICTRRYTKSRSKGHKGAICNSCTSRERERRMRNEIFSVAGKCCVKCGYNKCEKAIDYHHVVEKSKLFEISYIIKSKSKKILLNEALKCIPLCSNCHREFHAGVWKYNDIPQSSLKEYQKELLLTSGVMATAPSSLDGDDIPNS